MHEQVLNRRSILQSAIALTAAIVLGNCALVQARQAAPPLFENLTIKPKFTPDPLTVRGISGGAIPAKKVAGRAETANGPCVGFVDRKPDHTLKISDFFNYLSLQVRSPEDTTIIIRGPGGTWCNDDTQGKNPGIAGEWLPGNYNVWIGSYGKNKYHPYVLNITEDR